MDRTITRKQKFVNITYWREKYGDEFAEAIMDVMRERKKSGKGK